MNGFGAPLLRPGVCTGRCVRNCSRADRAQLRAGFRSASGRLRAAQESAAGQRPGFCIGRRIPVAVSGRFGRSRSGAAAGRPPAAPPLAHKKQATGEIGCREVFAQGRPLAAASGRFGCSCRLGASNCRHPFGPFPGADKVQLGSAEGVCIRRRRGLRPCPGGSGMVAGRRSPVGHRQPPPCISKNDADDNLRGFGSQGLPHPTLSPFQGWANHASLSGSGFSGFGADILHPLPEMGAPGRCCCAARERARLPPQAAQVLISLVFRQCVPVQRRCAVREGGRPSGTLIGPVWTPACMATGSRLVCVGGDAASHTSVESMGPAHRSAATTAGCKRGGQAAGPHFDSRAHPI